MAGTANITLPGAPNYPVPGTGSLGQVNGGMNGGLLRPGAIDQARFQQLLAAQGQVEAAAPPPGLTLNDYRKLAGKPPGPAPAPAPEPVSQGTMIDGIPNLTAEQFAALTGLTPMPEAAATEAAPPDDLADLAAPEPQAVTPPTVGAPLEMVSPVLQAQLAAANPTADAEAPTVDDLAVDDAIAVAATPDAAPEAASTDPESGDPRVVWLDRVPDRDERRELTATGKRWRLRETPGANELFLGPDGKFGWDDFIDIINPLQHIPVVAQIYRAVTGDQAYAASQFAGAIPFGPISVASAVLDTIVRSQTGRDAGTDIAAAVLGIDNRTPEEANLHLVAPPRGDAIGDYASRNAASQEDAVQTAETPARIFGYNPNAGDRG